MYIHFAVNNQGQDKRHQNYQRRRTEPCIAAPSDDNLPKFPAEVAEENEHEEPKMGYENESTIQLLKKKGMKMKFSLAVISTR